VEIPVAILWKNILQLSGKSTCKKHADAETKELKIFFKPSLEFIYDTDIDDTDKLNKIIFFYQLNQETDKSKQRIWKQKYELIDGKLSKNEWEIMKKHSEIGYRIAMSSPELEPIAEYILAHHERWDGNGYPQGLKGEEIPLLSRILAVVDSYDAMTEDRVYRKAMTHQAAIEEIKKNAGTQFDPNIAQIFIDSL
jgi:HD-GYP domain-containing protein (c-di-GMP phosphodiesterase class II)